MNDFLLELGKNERARRLIQGLGLPIPVPQALMRAEGPAIERPLSGLAFAVYGAKDSAVTPQLASALARAGGSAHILPERGLMEHFQGPAEAYSLPFSALSLAEGDGQRFAGLVFDATTLSAPKQLEALHEFFYPLVRRLSRCGRAVVITRPDDQVDSPEAAATQLACDGFVRSLAKELGRRGATAGRLNVEPGAEALLDGPLRFLLSEASAYVSGQTLTVKKAARALQDGWSWSNPLEGKVALVTGAARGIGARTAHLLAQEGAKVVCLDRPEDDGPASRLARELDGEALLVDVSALDGPERIAEHLRVQHGGVDVVVHNAGITRDKTLAKMSKEIWSQVLDINLQALLRINRALEDGGIRDGGRIICLSSIAGIAGNMGQTNYAASKAGVIGLVRAWAKLLAPRGITVNAVAPGFIETRLTSRIPVAVREVGRRLNSLGQGGLPEDVAQAINFLASPSAQGITGEVLRVCGGSLLGA